MDSNLAVIRAARGSDEPFIRAITRAAYSKYTARIGREPAPMLADIGAAIAAHQCAVAIAGACIVGYRIGWAENSAYFIEDVAIDPAQQGRGYGRMLMQDAKELARRLSLPALRLYTNAAMVENLAIYKHMGFVETHRTVENGYARVYLRLSV